jgi:ligand-binding SRPBCC domain-containing protein
MLPLFKVGLGGRLGSGQQWMSWIHLDDIVNLYVSVMEDGTTRGAVNAVAPNPVRNVEFTKVLAAQIKMPAVVPAPAFALKLALGEMSALLLESQRADPKNLPPDFKFRYPKVGDALGAVFKGVEKARGPLFHEHVSKAWVPAPPEEVFAFLADPSHLPRCTPPEYELSVDKQSTVRLAQDSWLTYSFRALGWRFTVRSHYLDWVENHRYATIHQRGPFSFWHHLHSFERMGSGTLITEKLVFRLRFAFLGSAAGYPLVAGRLERAFRYRAAAIYAAMAKRAPIAEHTLKTNAG